MKTNLNMNSRKIIGRMNFKLDRTFLGLNIDYLKLELLICFLFFVPFILNAQNKIDTLTNVKIIKLTKLKLSPSIIITKIQSSYNRFDISTDALIGLSENGVSSDVINAMMNTTTKAQIASANQKDLNDPATMRRTGIYYYDPNNLSRPIRRVDPTVTSTGKSGSFGTALAQAYTYGIAKSKVKSNLAGKNSRLQLVESTPTFYFYFENNANPKADDWFFASATSPNEFVFVKLKERDDSREMVIGDANAYSTSSGISNKVKIEFIYEEVTDGIYKVEFKKPLEKGEYCFLYASATPTQYANNKVWDVGIPNGQTGKEINNRASHPSPPNPFKLFKKKETDTVKTAGN